MDVMTNPISPAAARAHALKNCLTVVSAISRLLESELSERSRARLERSQEAVSRMLALIQDDLIAECSPGAPPREFVLAEDVLRMVVGRIEDEADAKGVSVRVEAGPGGVMGVAAELAEALVNIVLNAVRATPSGGTVLVATHELPDGSQVWAVQDAGPGIPDDIRDRVGTPYFSGSKGGSGLGLALARDIFEMHRGQLNIRSVRGAGTLVSARLPVMAEGSEPLALRVARVGSPHPSCAPSTAVNAPEAWRCKHGTDDDL